MQIILVPAMMDALSFPLTLAMAMRKLKIDQALEREGGRATVIIGGASRSANASKSCGHVMSPLSRGWLARRSNV